MPLERDEGEYAYGGQLLLHGVLPYQLLYTMKLPGTHAAYAVLMALFGQNCAGVHLGFLVVNCATVVLVFCFARCLAGTVAGPIAAGLYAILSLSVGVLGTAAHATHFVVFFAMSGLLLLWQSSKSGRLIWFFGSGLLLGSSVLMKQNGVLFAAFGALCFLWLGCSRSFESNRSLLKAGGAFFLGMATPLALLTIVLWQAHTLQDCWFWSVSCARAYSLPYPGVTLTWRIMTQRMPPILQLPLYAAICGAAAFWLKQGSRQAATFATAFMLVSLLAVIPSYRFRPHYFVLLLPAVSVLTGTLAQQATDFLLRRFRPLAPVPNLAVAIFIAAAIARDRAVFFQLTPPQASNSIYGTELFSQALVLGDYLRERAAPEARIAVLGSEPEIYFYAHRRSATGYVYTYPLTEHQPFSTRMTEQMKQEIQTGQPQFLIQVRDWISWQGRPGSAQRLVTLWDSLTPPHYTLIGVCEFNVTPAKWHWDSESSRVASSGIGEMRVFQRGAADIP